MDFKRYKKERFVVYGYSEETGQYAPFIGCSDPKDAFNAARIRAKQLKNYHPIDENGIEFNPTDVRVFELPMDKVVAIYNEDGLVLIDHNLGLPQKHPKMNDVSAFVQDLEIDW